MASATPDLRLPSQPQAIAALRLVPKSYCLVTEARVRVCEGLAQGRYTAAERWAVDISSSKLQP